ncbi:hypothetical protein BCR34DRAFT_616332 [Clohesyomyces aquaticus]|uniref:Uncharacterized protein n=1 Tax=Clohesyomyces aquaticus TaxID=1231657 RepID=A0A1Y1ZFI8_9PLEO|nr:hypothetical protein BCR34DRAFT_616332 [Clohesyomyces aquaticus]
MSFVFMILSIISRDWARQNHYDPSLDQLAWKAPIFANFRSPFVVCSPKFTGPDIRNATTISLTCLRYRPYGFGKTSCETVFATQSYQAAVTGDERLCQQIHCAGNLMIASSVFSGISLVLMLAMCIASIWSMYKRQHNSTDGAQTEEARSKEEQHDPPRRSDRGICACIIPYMCLF